MTETHRNLLAAPGTGPAPTLLPDDPAAAELEARGREEFLAVVAAHPSSSLCWALLAEGALAVGGLEGNLGAYASQYGPYIPYLGATMLTGIYRTPQIFVRVRGVYTNVFPPTEPPPGP